jgi:hypothetical protein
LKTPKREPPEQFLRGLKHGYRSGLEIQVAKQLEQAGIDVDYENLRIQFVQPSKVRTYTPDFVLPNGIIIETKGRFTSADRQKHLFVQQQYPELDIRFVFANPNQRLNKTSKTTYAKWCEKNGFKYAAKLIPESWLKEPKKELPFNKGVYRRDNNDSKGAS